MAWTCFLGCGNRSQERNIFGSESPTELNAVRLWGLDDFRRRLHMVWSEDRHNHLPQNLTTLILTENTTHPTASCCGPPSLKWWTTFNRYLHVHFLISGYTSSKTEESQEPPCCVLGSKKKKKRYLHSFGDLSKWSKENGEGDPQMCRKD